VKEDTIVSNIHQKIGAILYIT